MGKIPNQKKETTELDRYERIVDRAHKEIGGVQTVYKLLFGCLTVIFVFGVTLAVIFIGKDSREVKSRLNDEVEIVRRRVIDRIDEEFKTENIHELIVNRVDVVAGQLISDLVKEKVDPEIEKIGIELKALKGEYNKLQSEFATISDDQELRIKNFVSAQDEKTGKMNDSITRQREQIDQLLKAVNTQMQNFKKIAELYKQPELTLSSQPIIQEVEAGYDVKLKFDPPKDKYLGVISFEIQVVDASAAKILDVSRAGTGISMNVKHTWTKDRKKATFQYSPMSPGLQQIKIQVSGTCKLLISGNYLAKPINVVVK